MLEAHPRPARRPHPEESLVAGLVPHSVSLGGAPALDGGRASAQAGVLDGKEILPHQRAQSSRGRSCLQDDAAEAAPEADRQPRQGLLSLLDAVGKMLEWLPTKA